MIPRLAMIGLTLLAIAIAGCSGGGSSDEESSPTATAGPSRTATSVPPTASASSTAVPPSATMTALSSPSPSPSPCPVADEVCGLAGSLLTVLRSRNPDALVDQTKRQALACPRSGTESEEESTLAAACVGRGVGSVLEVYEVHTGKGPFYLENREEYRAEISKDIALLPASNESISVKAIGCGLRVNDSAIAPDCSVASIVVFTVEGKPTDLGLVLSRQSTAAAWTIEKYWRLYPGALPETVPDGASLDINTVAGVRAVQLHPYN